MAHGFSPGDEDRECGDQSAETSGSGRLSPFRGFARLGSYRSSSNVRPTSPDRSLHNRSSGQAKVIQAFGDTIEEVFREGKGIDDLADSQIRGVAMQCI